MTNVPKNEATVDVAEHLGTFRDAARALTHIFRTSRDQGTLEAAKTVVHCMLAEMSDDVNCSKARRARSETPSQDTCRIFKQETAKATSAVSKPSPPAACTASPPPPLRLWHRRPSLRVRRTRSPRTRDNSWCDSGEWRHKFERTSLLSPILNAFFDEAEDKGNTRNFRTYIGPGSGGSSEDKLSLDLKFNPMGHSDHFPTSVACVMHAV